MNVVLFNEFEPPKIKVVPESSQYVYRLSSFFCFFLFAVYIERNLTGKGSKYLKLGGDSYIKPYILIHTITYDMTALLTRVSRPESNYMID